MSVVSADNAGNETTAKKVITVNPRPTSNGNGGGSTTNGGGGAGVVVTPPKIEGPSQSTAVGAVDVVAPSA